MSHYTKITPQRPNWGTIAQDPNAVKNHAGQVGLPADQSRTTNHALNKNRVYGKALELNRRIELAIGRIQVKMAETNSHPALPRLQDAYTALRIRLREIINKLDNPLLPQEGDGDHDPMHAHEEHVHQLELLHGSALPHPEFSEYQSIMHDYQTVLHDHASPGEEQQRLHMGNSSTSIGWHGHHPSLFSFLGHTGPTPS